MRNGLLGSFLSLTAGAGLALADTPVITAGHASVSSDVPVYADAPAYDYMPAPGGCGGGGCCEPRHWGGIEGIYYLVKDGPAKFPLATTSPLSSLGIVGNPGTTGIGNEDFGYSGQMGFRATAGMNFKHHKNIGVELSGFWLDRRSDGYFASSDATGGPLLARPFFDTSTGTNNALLVSAPGFFAGGIRIDSSSRLWGAEANATVGMSCRSNPVAVDLIAGFRYLSLDEDLTISNRSELLPAGLTSFIGTGILPPASVSILDTFRAKNDFYGPQVGLFADYCAGRFFVQGTAKVAVGVIQQTLQVAGVTTLAEALPAPVSTPGGLLAVATNSGTTTKERCAVVPEVGVKVGVHLSDRLSLTAGYNFLYVSRVLRPGGPDTNVNPTFVPVSPTFGVPFGPRVPTQNLDQSDFFAHGYTAGLQFTY